MDRKTRFASGQRLIIEDEKVCSTKQQHTDTKCTVKGRARGHDVRFDKSRAWVWGLDDLGKQAGTPAQGTAG